MCAKSANDVFSLLCDRLTGARSLLVTTHARSDGDALGSMAALAGAARAAGKSVACVLPDALPERYGFLFPDQKIPAGDRFAALADAADLVVIVDTCAASQLEGIAEAIVARRDKVAVVDHHRTVDDLGSVQWIDASAAAAGIMVMQVIEHLEWPMPLAVAEALMVAVTTDTGWLHFANTDAAALRAVAQCVAAGVRPDLLYKKLYQTDRPERLKLIGRVLESLELHCDGALAAMTIRKSDFLATGATCEETENLVNEALRVASVETAIILVENGALVRVSLRSRDAIDVAEIARQYGGGGHRRAAGVRLAGDIDELKTQLVQRCTVALKAAGVG
ncbi:MAG: DHH family phosphoesterase [Planctomycetaceae bacterium]|nr:DHH family phosphoesterase [Planctomycetaceae bacterium]